jgi:excisionase family DNA binding protein
MARRKAEPPAPLVHSITDTAALLNSTRDFVYKLIRDGELEQIRLSGRPFITDRSIQAALANRSPS